MNMRLLCVFTAILALSLAEEPKKEHLEDLVAQETVELMKDDLNEAASAYNAYVPPSQRPWNPPQNYVPQHTWTQQQDPIQPVNYIPPSPPAPPQNDYIPPQNTYPPVYYPPHNTWKPPHHHHHPTTTPVTVIKNEQNLGPHGSYNYEYKTSDGTHVGEEGYYTQPEEEKSLVKRGWYSFTGENGKVYTVKWWADHTGFHAYGDHLPTPPPVPHAIQVALDEAAQADEPVNNKPQYYPPKPEKPQNVYYPPQPEKPYYPPQQPIYPPQPTYPTYHQ